jgi:hypothetical protein
MRTGLSGNIWLNMQNFNFGAGGTALTELAQLTEYLYVSLADFFDEQRWQL